MRALVLSAGLGTRLGAITQETPKPMLDIGGEPLLAHTLRHLARHGFTEVAINLHFMPRLFKDYFGDGAKWGVTLHYSEEEALLGTAGSVKRLAPYLALEEDFLVLYGDLLIDEDFAAMMRAHREKQAAATLLLHARPGSNSLVRMEDDERITAFIERPTDEERARSPYPWVNSGAQILHRRLLSRIPEGKADLPRDVYMPALREERLFGYPLTGFRCAIDSPARYEEAKRAFAEGRYRTAFSKIF
jgi:NDP-sugar pyrophosphorylase family protein